MNGDGVMLILVFLFEWVFRCGNGLVVGCFSVGRYGVGWWFCWSWVFWWFGRLVCCCFVIIFWCGWSVICWVIVGSWCVVVEGVGVGCVMNSLGVWLVFLGWVGFVSVWWGLFGFCLVRYDVWLGWCFVVGIVLVFFGGLLGWLVVMGVLVIWWWSWWCCVCVWSVICRWNFWCRFVLLFCCWYSWRLFLVRVVVGWVGWCRWFLVSLGKVWCWMVVVFCFCCSWWLLVRCGCWWFLVIGGSRCWVRLDS